MRGPWDRPHIKAETAEEIEQIQTIAGLRRRIFEMRQHDPLVRRVLDISMVEGLNTEETFARLSYFALVAKDEADDRLLEYMQTSGPTPFVVSAREISPTVKTDVKLIDELLLIVMRDMRLEPADLERERGLTEAAMRRLRRAHQQGYPLTATWAEYFEKTKEA
jgi:hypothetical protein